MAPLLVLDNADPVVLSEADARGALLTLDDVGAGYREQAPEVDRLVELGVDRFVSVASARGWCLRHN